MDRMCGYSGIRIIRPLKTIGIPPGGRKVKKPETYMLEHVKTTCFSCAFQLFTRCAGIAFLHLEETGLGNKQMVLLSASALTDPCVYHPSIHPSSCLIGSMLRHLWGHINQSQLADWGQLGRVTHGSAWSAKVLHGLFCLELQMLQGQTRKNWVMVILLYYIILYIYWM